jgi:predicted alpha/beta-hydrolase family hydrolase
MSAEILKFPYDACRRVHSKKPRRSKNGTPAERTAKAEALRARQRRSSSLRGMKQSMGASFAAIRSARVTDWSPQP